MVLLVEDNPGGQRGVRVLTLNRPERRNALSPELLNALIEALAAAEKNNDVRVVVLTGAGDKAFCAGGDLGDGMKGDGFFAQHKERGGFAELVIALRRFSKPLVGAVNGVAVGGGFGLVLSCDLAVAAEDAELGTPEVKRGLFPMMIASLIYEQLPTKAANELVLLGGKIVGQRAVEIGVVNKVVPKDQVLSEALKYAVQLASLSPSVMQLGKRAIAQQREMPFDQKVAFLRDQLTLNLMLEDAAEGISAFLQKRDPDWKGR